jgi:pimeloyl-ACP methyl ester carboxylesterase
MDLDIVFVPAVILAVGVLILSISCRRLLFLRFKAPHNGWRGIEQIALCLAILPILALTASNAFNAYKVWSFHPKEPPGNMYLVDGQRMHIDCTGDGSPTLVLESGWGSAWEVWGRIQPDLSKIARVCSYDRAGYGYSEPRSAPRDADHIALELHDLLLQAHIAGPLVLMGHSFGGLIIRDYATRYPDQVAGLIFVDSVTPSWGLEKIKAPPMWFTRLGSKMACMTNAYHFVGACSWPRPGMDRPRWQQAMEGVCDAKQCALGPEEDSFQRSGEETLQTGPYGELPVLIFSHDPARWPAEWESGWDEMQEDLMKLSSRSRRVIAKKSTHVLSFERPDLISKEVSLFVEQIRGKAPQPANYGTTVTE